MFCKLFGFTIMMSIVIPGLGMRARQQPPTPTPTGIKAEAPTVESQATTQKGTDIPPLSIESPHPGQALQGTVTIIGIIPLVDIQNAEITFSFINNPTNTWFLIHSVTDPIGNEIVAEWDTTTITDGTYNLRMTVITVEGEQLNVDVSQLRVRNYTPIETNTPTPVSPTPTPIPGSSPTPTETLIPPTSTQLPKNPAQLTTGDIILGFGKGVLAIIGIFALVGLYVVVRKVSTNK